MLVHYSFAGNGNTDSARDMKLERLLIASSRSFRKIESKDTSTAKQGQRKELVCTMCQKDIIKMDTNDDRVVL